MEDGGGLGSLIFYIILGILAIAGSFHGKGKKQKTAPKRTEPGRPDMETSTPPVRPEPAPVQRKPRYVPIDPSMEGRYEEPMAGEFSDEGSISQKMAGAFSSKGSSGDMMARAFAREGSFDDSMAKAFASEGVSSFKDFQTSDFVHTEISDSEIGDAPEYDYNARPGSDILDEEFDVKKALIYSVLLNRKEYSY
ncbi:MAG: hypothetical protein LC630_00030 [Bacteroidales bacterium]|nr:hypothetical protein [Bacteroidales bacterium]